jgi:hypothetical protein
VNAALIKDININGTAQNNLIPQILLIRNTSPNKLIEGGADILQMLTKNHHRAIEGMVCINPLQIIILRDPVRSYTIFVNPNIAEEHNPCAIIITTAPSTPV